MTRGVRLIGFALLAGVLSGCSWFTGGAREISFELPAGDGLPSHFFVRDLSEPEGAIRLFPAVEGTNTTRIVPGGVYMIGFVDTDADAAFAANRGLGSAVSLVGNLHVASNGLDSVPIADAGGDSVALGTVEENEGQFVSDAGSQEVSEQTGYSEDDLAAYGSYDDTLRKFLNPDIDANGELDDEQELRWELVFQYEIPLNAAAPDRATGTLGQIPAASEIGLTCMIQFDEGLPTLPDWRESTLTVQPDSGTEFTVNAVDGYTNNYIETTDWADGYDYTFFFDIPVTNGTYILNADQTYTIRDARFVDPGNGLEGVLIPYITFERGADDIIESFSWTWHLVRDGRLTTPSADQVGLQIRELSFKVGYLDGNTGIEYDVGSRSYNEPGRWDVTFEEINGSDRTPGYLGRLFATPLNEPTGTVDISSVNLFASGVDKLLTSVIDTAGNAFYLIHAGLDQ